MVGEIVGGRYELIELVGTGGMSSVYRAHDRLLERDVALKLLHDYYRADDETIERFRREARAAAQLSHANIVTVIDRGEDGGRQFIVFEYVDGETLKALVQREGRLPVRRALEIALATARALAFAHRHGLVHRDVKPQNVLLNGDGRAKVTDFGIARSLELEGVTQTGTVLGTSDYIAPEQASGQRVTAQTDVYSLGVVLFELLTGEVPFRGENFVAVAMRHMNEPPPSVLELRPDVPVRVANAVDRALEKDPAQRFRSMDEMVAELQVCLAELGEPDADRTLIVRPGPAGRVTPRPERPRGRRRVPIVLLLALATFAGAAALGYALVGYDVDGADGGPGGGPSGKPAIRLEGVASYDPEGGDGEHDERVADATDGNRLTYWPTETYGTFTKSGVGLVLDAGKSVSLDRLTVVTTNPGFTARIDSGGARGGPFRPVSGERTVGSTATFELEGDEARYYVVWITSLPGNAGVATINEVTAR